MGEATRLGLIILLAGASLVTLQAVFVMALYRLAELRTTRLEKKRWVFSIGWKFLLVIVASASIAAGMNLILAIALSLFLVGIPVVVASYVLRGRHWMFTLATDETAALEGRREMLIAVRRRPAFWLLVASFMLAVPIMSLAIIAGLGQIADR
jgi:hypothetical protein